MGYVDVNHNNDHKTGSLGRKVDNFNEMVKLGNGLRSFREVEKVVMMSWWGLVLCKHIGPGHRHLQSSTQDDMHVILHNACTWQCVHYC